MEELVSKIVEGTKLTEKEITEKIREKEEELSGLVSSEGAAYIVAKELGLDLLEKRETRLKLANVIPGMRNVSVLGKVMSVSDVREFEKNGNKGKVANAVIADESGSLRLSLWNEETKHIGKVLSVGNVIELVGCYVKEDNLGNPEIRLGKFGRISSSKENIEAVEMTPHNRGGAKRVALSDAREGQFIETRAVITTIFEGRWFFEVCPECEMSLKDGVCLDHGKVKGKQALVVTGVLDDGSGNMRFVAYRSVASKMLGVEESATEDEVLEASKKVQGKEFVFMGKVKKNDYFENLELSISGVEEVDVEKEINHLI